PLSLHVLQAFLRCPARLDLVTLLITGRISFFFSSRRRHTKFDCDWSSDVCSSDLKRICPARRRPYSSAIGSLTFRTSSAVSQTRSEERRVGKECISRWVRGHEDY